MYFYKHGKIRTRDIDNTILNKIVPITLQPLLFNCMNTN